MKSPGNFKNILAIRFMRLGDVVLLLPALSCLKAYYPDARLTLLTDDRCVPIAELCPNVDEVIGVDRLKMRDGSSLEALKKMTGLVYDIRKRQFDLVVDFLSFRETNLLSWLSRAPYRLGMKRYDRAYLKFCFNLPPILEDKSLHVSEMFQRMVNAITGNPGPLPSARSTLKLSDEALRWLALAAPPEPFLALYAGAPVSVRRWPAEGFTRVADFAIENWGAPVAVLAGPSESATAMRVRDLSRYPEQIHLFHDLTLPQLAALIARARVLVSNDTGPMHLGPAFGVPTLGLFSVGYPRHYHPLGVNSRFLRANPIDRISPDDVIRHIADMWELVINPSD